MPNPFRSEESAFRFVWLTIGYFAPIVVAAWINKWLGFAVFAVLTAGVAFWLFRRSERERPPKQAPASHVAGRAPDPRRRERDRRRAPSSWPRCGGAPPAPPVSSSCARRSTRRVRHWVSDEDDARAAAQERLDASLASMRAAGVEADGEIGDGDPIQAIADAIRTFRPDELILSTHPEGRSHWLERGVVEKARERFDIQLTHVVVDLDSQPR